MNSFSLAVPQSLTFSFPEPASAKGRMEMLHEGFLEVMLWPAVMYLVFKDWAEKTQGDAF